MNTSLGHQTQATPSQIYTLSIRILNRSGIDERQQCEVPLFERGRMCPHVLGHALQHHAHKALETYAVFVASAAIKGTPFTT